MSAKNDGACWWCSELFTSDSEDDGVAAKDPSKARMHAGCRREWSAEMRRDEALTVPQEETEDRDIDAWEERNEERELEDDLAGRNE